MTVGISGYGEFGPQVDAGKLRALAVSSEERLPGVDIPTLKEQGLDVAFFNWRGLFAPPDIRTADLEALQTAITGMVKAKRGKTRWPSGSGPTSTSRHPSSRAS